MQRGWRTAAAPLPEVPRPAPQSGRRVVLIDKPGATQTYFWLGNIGVARDYEKRAALDIANTVFGGRFTSMLNTELRVNSGLTYGARSLLSRASQPGSIAISSYTPTESTVEAIDMALGVLGRLHEDGVDKTMLESAALWLKRNAQVNLQIEGHCDERGSNEYNDALGNRRAQAVVDFFTGFGLDASRFAIVSFGEDRPLVSRSDEDAWAQNRRAEFILTAGQNDINPGGTP